MMNVLAQYALLILSIYTFSLRGSLQLFEQPFEQLVLTTLVHDGLCFSESRSWLSKSIPISKTKCNILSTKCLEPSKSSKHFNSLVRKAQYVMFYK